MTAYVILRRDVDGGWIPTDAIDPLSQCYGASSPRRALLAANLTDGEYLAIPSRSWKPMIVKTETTTKVTIG